MTTGERAVIQDSLIHTRIGPYTIEALLGSGGVANVYRATDTRTGEDRALKVIHDAWATHEEMVQRFQQEARINKTLQHPHIVAVHDFGLLKGRPFMAMTYLPGGTLSRRFAQPNPLRVQEAVQILRRIGGAVDYAHRRGIMHQHVTQPLTPPSSIVPHLPPALDRMLVKALSKHPDDR